jgi:ribosomal protein S18 acetylase RimI-like enzyme
LLAKALELGLALKPAAHSDRAFIECLARRVLMAYGSYDRYLTECFDEEAVSTCVALLQGEPVGFYILTDHEHPEHGGGSLANLLAIVVDPAHQSCGIGRRLLRAAIDEARTMESSPREMWLFVAEGNSRGQRLFARHKFRFRGGVGIYPAGQRALAMVKTLS